MSITVIGDIKVKPEEVDGIISYLKEILPESRAYEGNQGFEVYRNQEDPNNLFIISQWGTREQQEKYVTWRTETGVIDKFNAVLTGPPSVRYLDHIET